MTKLSDYARPEWAAPRKETWYEHLLPQRATDAINQSPIVSALSRYLSSPTPQLSLDANKDWLLQQARGPSWFDRAHPAVQQGVDTVGALANFLGPGARLPQQMRGKVRGGSLKSATDDDLMEMARLWSDAYAKAVASAPNPGVSPYDHKIMSHPLSSFGVRVENRVMAPGVRPDPSKDFEGRRDFWQGGRLDGTSVYAIEDMTDPSSIAAALTKARDGGFAGRRLSLVADEPSGSGPRAGIDPGEWVFRKPIVAQQWRIGVGDGPKW